ncbi:MAG: hypothetical protein RLY14_1 [Planctomycetota bacterium]|jgi:hypothetical protein
MVLAVIRGDWWLLSAVFIFRLAVIAIPATILLTDPDSYLTLAKQLAASSTFGFADANGAVQPTAFRPPLYPAAIALAIKLFGQPSVMAIGILHSLSATCSAGFLLLIGRRLAVPYISLIAIAFSFDPLLVRQSQLLMTETLATTLALLSWWLCIQVYDTLEDTDSRDKTNSSMLLAGLIAGMSFGIATLTRPTAIVWLGLILLTFLASAIFNGSIITSMRAERGAKMRATAAILIGAMTIIAPWMIRNQREIGKPIWATTHGGYTLLLANNPILYDHLASGSLSRDWDEDRFHKLWANRDTMDPMSEDFWHQAVRTKQNVATDASGLSSETPSNSKEKKSDQTSRNHLDSKLHREIIEDQLAQKVAIATIRERPAIATWSAVVRLGWLWTPLPNPRPDSASKWLICVWYIGLYVVALLGAYKLGAANKSFPWFVGWLLVLSVTMVHAVYWSNMRMRSPALPMLYLLTGWGLPCIWTAIFKRKTLVKP